MDSSLTDSLKDLQELAREHSTIVTVWVTEDGSLEPLVRLQLDDSQSSVTIIPTRAAKVMFPRILGDAVFDEPYLIEDAQPEVIASLLGIPVQRGEPLSELFDRAASSAANGKFAVGRNVREIDELLRQPADEFLLLNPEGSVEPELVSRVLENTDLVPVMDTPDGYCQVNLRQAPLGVPQVALAIEHSIQRAMSEAGIPVCDSQLVGDNKGVATLLEVRPDRLPMAGLFNVTKRQLKAGPVTHTLNESLCIATGGADIHLSDSAAAARVIGGVKSQDTKKSVVAALYAYRMMGNVDLTGDFFTVMHQSDAKRGCTYSLAPLRTAGSYGFFQATSSSLKTAYLMDREPPLDMDQKSLMKSLKALRAYDLDHPADSREAFETAKEVLSRSVDIMAQLEKDGQAIEGLAAGYRSMLKRPLTGVEGWNQSLASVAKDQVVPKPVAEQGQTMVQ